MGLHIGAVTNPLAALVIAMLLCLLLGFAGVVFVVKKLVAPRPRRERHDWWRRAA